MSGLSLGVVGRTPTPDLRSAPGKLYEQIATLVQKRIDSGAWVRGERLPSIAELATSFGVAVVTIRRALELLEERGSIERRQGLGTFVASGAPDKHWLKLESNWEALIRMWGRSKPRPLKVSDSLATPALLPEDGIPAPGYRHMRRVHSADDSPYAVSDLFVDRRLYARCPQRFDTEMVIVVLDSLPDVHICSMRQRLTIDTADIELAGLLGIAVGAPVGIMRRVVRDRADTVIYVGEATYRGDMVRLERELTKPDA
jgi:GntR family transcriptional regulator